MAKTKEELQKLKTECEGLLKELRQLSEEELNAVTGGVDLKGFFGALSPLNTGADAPKTFVRPEDQQIVGELPRIKDDERYVM